MSEQTAHILLLADQPEEVASFQDMLEKAGVESIELHPVFQFETALDNLNQIPFEIIIIDLKVVVARGQDFITSVRNICADISIILLTDIENLHQVDPILKYSVDDCLVREHLQGDSLARTLICAMEKRHLKKQLLAAEDTLQKLVEQIIDGILIVGADKIIQHANEFAEVMFGSPQGGLAGALFEYPLVSNGKMDIEIPRKEAKPLKVEMYVVPTEWKHEEVYMVILRDITEQQEAQEQLRLSAKVFETTAEGIFITDKDSNIISANQSFSDITGYSFQEVVGKNAMQFHSDHRDCEFYRQTWNSIAITERWQGEIWNRRKDGGIYTEWVTISTVKDDQGELTNYIVIFTDISSRKQSEERLKHLATHDPLTDLPNRDLFYDRLEQALMRARRNRVSENTRWMIAVMLLDLDGFKLINDTLGHAQGDYLLQVVAKRLQNCVRMSDSVARLGGDEFTVVIENLSDARNPSLVAEKILKALAAPVLLAEKEYSITASIGISVYPIDGEDSISLLKHADIAMYRAKEKHNTFEYYSLPR
ncbi:MAG: diguanylate cyclase [Anaerolineales bacterium]|nr:diguanylate cyclase [Anaerolineales bacterium]